MHGITSLIRSSKIYFKFQIQQLPIIVFMSILEKVDSAPVQMQQQIRMTLMAAINLPLQKIAACKLDGTVVTRGIEAAKGVQLAVRRNRKKSFTNETSLFLWKVP